MAHRNRDQTSELQVQRSNPVFFEPTREEPPSLRFHVSRFHASRASIGSPVNTEHDTTLRQCASRKASASASASVSKLHQVQSTFSSFSANTVTIASTTACYPQEQTARKVERLFQVSLDRQVATTNTIDNTSNTWNSKSLSRGGDLLFTMNEDSLRPGSCLTGIAKCFRTQL